MKHDTLLSCSKFLGIGGTKMEINQNKLLCGEETFLDLVKGQNLVKANGSVKKCEEVLSGKKLIILYFSANWCQACTEFTPTLRDFYDYVYSRGVEIIFVSSDGSPEEMFRYMKNSHGNWYAVQYGSDLAKKLTQKYDVWGIQCSSGLVVLSENGSVITKNGRNLVSEMGPEVIYTWSNQISRNRYRYYESQDSSDSDPEDDDNEDICTFTQTGTSFRKQHWYYCHTCDFEDNAGVCSVCVKTCHSNHDVSYAKYSRFFCDCGAKGEKSCQALTEKSDSDNNKSDNTKNFCDLMNRKNLAKSLQLKRKDQEKTIMYIHKHVIKTDDIIANNVDALQDGSEFESEIESDTEIESEFESETENQSDIDNETSDSYIDEEDEMWEQPRKTMRSQINSLPKPMPQSQNRFKILEMIST